MGIVPTPVLRPPRRPDVHALPVAPVMPGAVFVIATILLAACSTSGPGSGDTTAPTGKPAITVAAALYPIEEVIVRVGGNTVDLLALTPPGEDAHDRELTAKQLDRLADADAVFYLGEDFQPSIQKAIDSLGASVTAVDLLASMDLLDADTTGAHSGEQGDDHSDEQDHAHGAHDPHVWLDPARMATITRTVARTLAELVPTAATEFTTNADAYIAELEALGTDMDTGLDTCRSRVLVTAHAAFAYLAKRADLETHSISGLNPNEEPSAKQLEELEALVRDEQVSTIFYETLLPGDIARTIADATGARTDLLDPIENISAADRAAGVTYLSIQRENLARLVAALGCA